MCMAASQLTDFMFRWNIFFLWTKKHALFRKHWKNELFKKKKEKKQLRTPTGKDCFLEKLVHAEGAPSSSTCRSWWRYRELTEVRIRPISQGANVAATAVTNRRLAKWVIMYLYCRILYRHEKKYKSTRSAIELSPRQFLKRWEECPHLWLY